MKMKRWAVMFALALAGMPAHADMSYQLEQLVGYTIVDVKTVEGWYDEDGEKGDAFEGCDFGRTIVFADDRVLECSAYHYSYAYRPRAVILSKGSSFKMLIDDHVYEMAR